MLIRLDCHMCLFRRDYLNGTLALRYQSKTQGPLQSELSRLRNAAPTVQLHVNRRRDIPSMVL